MLEPGKVRLERLDHDEHGDRDRAVRRTARAELVELGAEFQNIIVAWRGRSRYYIRHIERPRFRAVRLIEWPLGPFGRRLPGRRTGKSKQFMRPGRVVPPRPLSFHAVSRVGVIRPLAHSKTSAGR